MPTHVLRFWESKFDHVAPVKGSGGRRYYRPDDMRMLGGIKVLLHDQGQTIRAVIQKMEDEGPLSVMALSPALDAVDAVEAKPRKPRKVIRPGSDGPGEGDAVVEVPTGPDDPAAVPDAAPSDPVSDPQPDSVPVDAVSITGFQSKRRQPVPDPDLADAQPVETGFPGVASNDGGGQDPILADQPVQPDDVDDGSGLGFGGDDPPPPTPLDRDDPSPGDPSPAVAALRLVRDGGRPTDKRRLRRLTRRLRGLIDEIEEDLAS
ncbi:MerR family transcriptional regulator [Jannaschia sp. LMIT008]|uniref:MerR family transcriptional regulator n=1 Tax=Jannaschia maritima TaxID=3032585 RepID=UPI0035AC2504